MSNIKILFAEDDQTIRDILTERIEKEGYLVIPVSDGEEAWEKIQSESPDVIILDLLMPKKHGFEVLKDLRQNPPSPEKWQPVIIVSALSELDDIKKGYDLEADHYITKPCRAEDILKALKLMINLIPQRKTS